MSDMTVARKRYVLIVDDDEASANALEQMLRGFDISIVKSSNMNDAIRRLDLSRFEFIVTEYAIKGGDISKLMNYKKNSTHNVNTTVIVVSQDLDKEKVGNLMLNKVKYIVTKPVDKDKFLEVAKKFLK